jgi:esterase
MSYLSQFHHKIAGPESGPKLVFLHGIMGYWANWRGVISHFENEYNILAFDQRGHGRSIKPESGYSPEDYASDLKNILDELNWKSVNLVGHSMGGRNAMCFAAQFPHRINMLVIEDIGPSSKTSDPHYFENLLGRVPTPFQDKKLAKEFLYSNFDPRLGAYLYSNIDEVSPGVFDWRFSKKGVFESAREGRMRDRWEEFEKLKMPVLLMRGEKSLDLTKEQWLEALRRNPGVTGVEIKGAGHWIHSEKQAEFVDPLKALFRTQV